jgi:hypothetical protein
MKNRARLNVLPWIGLALLLILFLTIMVRLKPVNFFGSFSDDALYFSSARTLAEGQGYVLPSIPGTPPATKYPILLPWLLSFVWRFNPSFPGNIHLATAVMVTFGCGYVVASFLSLRRYAGIRDYEVLLLTAFCALHPVVLRYSATLSSDIPFAALSIITFITGDRYMRRDAGLSGAAVTGILSGLSLLLRVLGAPIATGILLCAIWRRAWRPAAVLAAIIAPFFLWVMWTSVIKPPAMPPAPFALFGPGWQQTWLYYTSYTGMRRLSIIDVGLTSNIFLSHVLYFIADTSGYFISPLFRRNVVLWFVSTLLTFAIILFGIRVQVKSSGWQPIHFSLFLYVAIILFWDYLGWDRFLLAFLPLFAAGFYLGAKELVSRAWYGRSSPFLIDKMIWGTLSAAILLLSVGVMCNFMFGERAELRAESKRRELLLSEKREMYHWITQNAPRDARVVTPDTEDGAFYLYTGRQAIRRIAFLPAGAYDEQITRRDLDHVMDVAQATGAQYWMTVDEYDATWKAYHDLVQARLSQFSSVLPELFRSSNGHVRILGLRCLQELRDPNCRAAKGILLPDNKASEPRTPQ